MQLNLAFLEIPSPSALALDNLDQAQRAAALDVLARLIAQAVELELQEDNDDD